MADKKITELNVLTAPVAGDLLIIDDISATETKAIDIEDLPINEWIGKSNLKTDIVKSGGGLGFTNVDGLYILNGTSIKTFDYTKETNGSTTGSFVTVTTGNVALSSDVLDINSTVRITTLLKSSGNTDFFKIISEAYDAVTFATQDIKTLEVDMDDAGYVYKLEAEYTRSAEALIYYQFKIIKYSLGQEFDTPFVIFDEGRVDISTTVALTNPGIRFYIQLKSNIASSAIKETAEISLIKP